MYAEYKKQRRGSVLDCKSSYKFCSLSELDQDEFDEELDDLRALVIGSMTFSASVSASVSPSLKTSVSPPVSTPSAMYLADWTGAAVIEVIGGSGPTSGIAGGGGSSSETMVGLGGARADWKGLRSSSELLDESAA